MSKFFIAWTIIIPDTLQCESYVLELNGSRSEPFVANSNIQTLTPIIETCKIRGELVGFDSSHHSSSVATFDISFGQQCKVGDVFQSKDRLIPFGPLEASDECTIRGYLISLNTTVCYSSTEIDIRDLYMKFGKDLNIVCKVQLEKIMSLKPTHSCCCSPAEIVDHVGLEELVQKDRINSLKQFFTSVDLILKSGITFTATNKMLVAVNEERTDVFDIIALTSYQDNTESYSLGMDLDALAHLTRASRACGRHQIDHAIAQCQLHLTKIVDHLHLLARSLENSNVNRTQMAKLMRDLDQVMKSTMQAIAGLSPIENDIPLLSSLIKQSRNLVYMVPTWHPNSDMTLSRLIGWTQCLLARTRYILLRPRWEQKTLSFMWSPCLVSILSYITNSFIKCIGSKPLSDDILDYLCSVGFTSFIDPSFSFCVEFLSSVIFAFKSTGEITLSKAHDTYIVNIPIINSKTSLNLENLRIKIFFVVCGDYVSSSVANEWIASHRSWRKHSVEKRILGFGNNTNNLTRANFVKSVNQLHFRLFDRALFCHIINLKSHENQSADGWDTRLGELVCE